jgi:hypothetical protein
MDLRFAGQFDFRRAPKRFPQYVAFDCQLIGIASVLVMAATAALKVRTTGLNAAGRGLDDSVKSCTRESRLLLGKLSFDTFAFKHKRHKDALAGSVFVRRQAGEAIAAVNQLLNLELH